MSLPTTDAGVRLQSAMNSQEVDLYSVLLSKARSVVDFGDSGSTLLAIRHRVKHIVSVKPNSVTLSTLRQVTQVIEAEKEGRITFVQPDVGKTNAKNKPIDKKRRDDWPLYYSEVWTRIHDMIPDIVFINGSFVLASALSAVEHIGPNTQVIISGGLRGRRIDTLSNFYELTSSVQNLAVFRPKSTFDRELLYELQASYRFDRRA